MPEVCTNGAKNFLCGERSYSLDGRIAPQLQLVVVVLCAIRIGFMYAGIYDYKVFVLRDNK